MGTTTLSMRVETSEARRLAEAARASGMERSAFLKSALRRGAKDLLIEQVMADYRRGDISLSRAAELAGISLHDLLIRMEPLGVELNYSAKDLEKDLHS